MLSLIHAIAQLFEHPQASAGTRVLNMGGGNPRELAAKDARQAALSQAQKQAFNAQIEADGARMYNQAHPGQVYHTNQNNEFAPGQLPSYLPNGVPNYIGISTGFNPHLAAQLAAARHPLFNPRPTISFQGETNDGYIPLQGSHGQVSSYYQQGGLPMTPQHLGMVQNIYRNIQ